MDQGVAVDMGVALGAAIGLPLGNKNISPDVGVVRDNSLCFLMEKSSNKKSIRAPHNRLGRPTVTGIRGLAPTQMVCHG